MPPPQIAGLNIRMELKTQTLPPKQQENQSHWLLWSGDDSKPLTV